MYESGKCFTCENLRIHISYENISPQIVRCERDRISNLISEDFMNLWANSIFLVGKLTQVFQMLDSTQYFMKERLHKCFQITNMKNFHVSYDHVGICDRFFF